MSAVVLPADHRQPQAWRNGGGVTFEVARAAHPQRAGDFLWRVSIANVAASRPFSSFRGYARIIAVIAGAGMKLRGLGPHDTVLVPFEVVRFDGADPVEGLLEQGPVKDFNVIFDPVLCRARLAFVDGSGHQPLGARTTLLVNVDAASCDWHCGTDGANLTQFDAIQFTGARDEPLQWQSAMHVALVEIDY